MTITFILAVCLSLLLSLKNSVLEGFQRGSWPLHFFCLFPGTLSFWIGRIIAFFFFFCCVLLQGVRWSWHSDSLFKSVWVNVWEARGNMPS